MKECETPPRHGLSRPDQCDFSVQGFRRDASVGQPLDFQSHPNRRPTRRLNLMRGGFALQPKPGCKSGQTVAQLNAKFGNCHDH